MLTIIEDSQSCEAMQPVRAAEEIEYLVKESEVVTGKPGRKFVIAGADRLVYRVQWHPGGYKVQRLDKDDKATCTLYMLRREFLAHNVGEALRAGQLFTPTVGC